MNGKRNLPLRFFAAFLGLTAHFLLTGYWSVAAYVFAYLGGRFLSGGRRLERLQKRTIDVHFLMIFVAAGAGRHRCVGRGRDAAVFVFVFRRARTLRARPDAKGNPLALPRRTESRHRAGCPGQRARGQVEQLTRGMRLLIKPARNFPWMPRLPKGTPPRTNRISPAKPRPSGRTSATSRLPAPSISGCG